MLHVFIGMGVLSFLLYKTSKGYYSKDNFIDKRPGEFYEYSNIGAGLAAHILESAFGRPFNVLTRSGYSLMSFASLVVYLLLAMSS